MTIECFEQIINDDRVSEIVIVDDCSTDGSYELLANSLKRENKVKLFRNEENIDCFNNKRRAIELATNEWCILADSDNIFGKDYLDSIYDYSWREDTILTPSWAAPHFSFNAYGGIMVGRSNVSEYIDKPLFEVMLNAANYFVNKHSYLSCWDGSIDPVTSDSIWVAYNWLKKSNYIYVVPHLTYTHRVHSGSHYKNNFCRTEAGLHEKILKLISELR